MLKSLALGCKVGVPVGDGMPGGVPGASASSEIAACDSELLRDAMGWLEGGVTGLASLGRLGSSFVCGNTVSLLGAYQACSSLR